MSANVQSMFYHGEKPWHGLGTKVESALTAAEALVAAGLNWTVEKRPLFTVDAAGAPVVKVNSRFANVRTDTGVALGVSGKRYVPLQNKDAFRVADAIVGTKEAHYETAGSLGQGERVWMLIRLHGDLSIGGDDQVRRYLLAANSHDGSVAATFALTPIRTVCENTLRLAISQALAIQRLRHTGNIGSKVTEVREALGLVNKAFADFEGQAKFLASRPVSQESFKSYLRSLELAPVGIRKEAKSERQFDRLVQISEYVTNLFEGGGKGSDLRTAKGTAWGAYSAVTEFVDHHQNPRVKSGKDTARAKSLLFGAGADLKDRALEKALELAA